MMEEPLIEVKQIEYLTNLQLKVDIHREIQHFSGWYRQALTPTVIVIATLLEKVHNFGHILRTLNGHNAMLIVPS